MKDYLSKIKAGREESSRKKEDDEKLEAFTSLATEIRTLLGSLEKTGAKKLDKSLVDAIAKLDTIAKSMKEVRVTSDSDIKNALIIMARAIQGIEIKPVVNVPQAKVEVKEREIDFTPLIKKINKADNPQKTLLTLADYKAQDINEDDPNIQYIGFVNPRGGWYIIENNTLDNSLRYKFGKDKYPKAWRKPAEHKFKLLNEALNEV